MNYNVLIFLATTALLYGQTTTPTQPSTTAVPAALAQPTAESGVFACDAITTPRITLFSTKTAELAEKIIAGHTSPNAGKTLQQFIATCTTISDNAATLTDHETFTKHKTECIQHFIDFLKDPLGGMILAGLVMSKNHAHTYLEQSLTAFKSTLSFKDSHLKKILLLKRLQTPEIKHHCTTTITTHHHLTQFVQEFLALFDALLTDLPALKNLPGYKASDDAQNSVTIPH